MALHTVATNELEALKEKQTTTQSQIVDLQKQLQRLSDTNLVISGAIQALTHLLEHHNTTTTTETVQQPQEVAIKPSPKEKTKKKSDD